MPLSLSRRQFLSTALATTVAAGSAGCGTILYPERRGQPAGPIDWGVVALDAVCLLFFFVPGVIAFAVDFATGAIYLPPPYYGAADGKNGRALLRTVTVPRDRLTAEGIGHAVSAASKQHVVLRPGEYRTRRLESIDEFWTTHDTYVIG